MSAIALRATAGDRLTGSAAREPVRDDLVELALVLPQWQVEALAASARDRGLTAGQVLRRLIGTYCATLAAADR